MAIHFFAYLLIIVFLKSIDARTSLNTAEINTCLRANNKLRNLHRNTPNLVWNNNLAAAAQRYAEKLVEMHRYRSNTELIHEKPARGMGENLYWGDNQKKATCLDASLAWYNEIKDYNFQTGRSINRKAVGHFTQLVWKNTREFGLGIATMKSRRFAKYGNIETFIVAKYSPKGNFHIYGRRLESYTSNVQPRKYGAVTPTIEELDPSSKQKCVNAKGDQRCNLLINSGYKCNGNFKSYFKNNCFKTCGYC